MAISFHCACGAKYKAKDSLAGKAITCKECGGTLTVPAAALETDAAGADAGEDDAPRIARTTEAPRIPKGKKKKSAAASSGKRSSYEGMTLEERIAARQAESEAARGTFSGILTGDIRPILLGGCSILLGIGAIVFAFAMPADVAADFAKERDLAEVMSMTKAERQGTGVLGAIYDTFGRTGLTVFLTLFGLGLILGGAWCFWNRHNSAED
jgi:hypothetical protein